MTDLPVALALATPSQVHLARAGPVVVQGAGRIAIAATKTKTMTTAKEGVDEEAAVTLVVDVMQAGHRDDASATVAG